MDKFTDRSKDERFVSMECAIRVMSSWLSSNKCEIDNLQRYVVRTYTTILSQIQQNVVSSACSSIGTAADIIESTVYPDYIVCLEDGKKLKMLKRHLWSKYDMTVDEYKRRWNLSYDYPVVAPNYAKKRSMIAKQSRNKRIVVQNNENFDVK